MFAFIKIVFAFLYKKKVKISIQRDHWLRLFLSKSEGRTGDKEGKLSMCGHVGVRGILGFGLGTQVYIRGKNTK